MSDLRKDLAGVLNCHNRECASDTPDFILAKFLQRCLEAWDEAMMDRERWHGDKIEVDRSVLEEISERLRTSVETNDTTNAAGLRLIAQEIRMDLCKIVRSEEVTADVDG